VVTYSEFYNTNRNQFYGWISFPSKFDLNIEKPEQIYKCGYINSVLAYSSKNNENIKYPRFNGCEWTISNTAYYCCNMDKFDGWIELEDVIPEILFGDSKNG